MLPSSSLYRVLSSTSSCLRQGGLPRQCLRRRRRRRRFVASNDIIPPDQRRYVAVTDRWRLIIRVSSHRDRPATFYFSSSSSSSSSSSGTRRSGGGGDDDDDGANEPPLPPTTTTTTVVRNTMTAMTTKESNISSSSNNNNNNNSTATSSTSDPPVLTWVETALPPALVPYARLARIDKPIGTMLLLWPCGWSVAVATPTAATTATTTAVAVATTTAGTLPDLSLLALFATGAFVMRGAGCTINDMWDRPFDRQVARTTDRPLASGQVTLPQATMFLVVQLLAGAVVLLSLPHPSYCFAWGCASLPLVAVYPATKRFFRYPQLILGLTINWGAIMGWAAVRGSIDPSIVVPLYTSGVTWTLLYDTLYAHQDKRDDRALGLHSTALTFGDQKVTLYGLAATTVLQWALVGYQAELAAVPYGCGVAAAAGHLLWQVQTANLDDPHNLATRFRSNATVGGIMFAAIVAGKYFA